MIFQRLPVILTVLFICLLASCGVGPDNSSSGPAVDPTKATLTPTADSLGYQAIAPQSCLVSDFGSMQTDRRQGNLIAWQPGTQVLAYVAPQSSTNWYIGTLSLAYGPDFTRLETLAGSTLTSGDLNWAPDGSKIAFLALRLNEALQTVMVINSDGSSLLDLFPRDSAQSDSRTSEKSILKWEDSNHLSVISSCGEDCQLPEVINVPNGSFSSESGKERKNQSATLDVKSVKDLDGLTPDQNQIPFDPTQYPKSFTNGNWSPDKNEVVYLDRKGILWLLNLSTKKEYVLDVGLRDVKETQWSSDGKLVAVRAEDRIFVFETPCAAPIK